jgi:hypothetical protein
VFGPTSPYNEHLTHPVAGLLVSNLERASADLRAAGAEIVLRIQHGGPRSWMHFRAPVGFVYELVEDPHDDRSRLARRIHAEHAHRHGNTSKVSSSRPIGGG